MKVKSSPSGTDSYTNGKNNSKNGERLCTSPGVGTSLANEPGSAEPPAQRKKHAVSPFKASRLVAPAPGGTSSKVEVIHERLLALEEELAQARMETVTTRDLMLDMMENIIAALKDHGHKETADAVLQSIIDKQPRNSGTPAQKGLPRKLTAGEDSKLKSKGKKKAAVKAAPAAKTVKAKAPQPKSSMSASVLCDIEPADIEIAVEEPDQRSFSAVVAFTSRQIGPADVPMRPAKTSNVRAPDSATSRDKGALLVNVGTRTPFGLQQVRVRGIAAQRISVLKQELFRQCFIPTAIADIRKRAGKHNALVALANATDAMQILEQEHGSNSESSLDVRIRSHGKISNYVEFISSILQKGDMDRLYVYAEGAAVSKLTTVVEIVKRKSLVKFSQHVTVGDTLASPCDRRLRNVELASDDDNNDDDSTCRKRICRRGDWTTTIQETSAPSSKYAGGANAPASKKTSSEVWMQVEIGTERN
ncbi:hypothetical protein IW138_003367 [Coemansia sp. RSA 986]|nr:hypothetical protein IW138_003367 [Coemansia sp. RSA 986]